MSELSTEQTSRTTDTPCTDIAFRLLELQQKLDAWDRLFNVEVAELRKDLSHLTATYLRECQTQQQMVKPRRQRRGPHPQTGQGRTTHG